MVKPQHANPRKRVTGYELSANRLRLTVAFNRTYTTVKCQTRFDWHKYFRPTPSSIRRLLTVIERRLAEAHEAQA